MHIAKQPPSQVAKVSPINNTFVTDSLVPILLPPSPPHLAALKLLRRCQYFRLSGGVLGRKPYVQALDNSHLWLSHHTLRREKKNIITKIGIQRKRFKDVNAADKLAVTTA